jgi:aminoglycoside N3'-acetyltransferase
MEMHSGLTGADIASGLRRLGLTRGAEVEVHSSLSSLGWVEGGADTVVDALMEVVGDEGAIIMSAYHLTKPLPLSAEDQKRGILAKVRFLDEDEDYPTGMGVIVDQFCKRPGTVMGEGLHRVCAWGHNAHLHSQGYEHLLDVDGWVLMIGVDIHRQSSMHIAEGRVSMPEEINQIGIVPADILLDYPEERWYIQYGETPEDAWGKIQDESERRGWIRHERIGNADCRLCKARPVVELYEESLRKDPFGLFGIRSISSTGLDKTNGMA